MTGRLGVGLPYLLVALLLAGCGALSSPEVNGRLATLADALRSTDELSGWTSAEGVKTFDRDNLYDLVDGQADAFFAYGFERVAVQRFENADGAMLRIEVWQLATAADAYGLFTTYRAGSQVDIGREGDADPGRRLDFWQDRYFVRLFAPQPLPDADLQAFGEAVSAELPSGGERPALVDRLPPNGLVERSAISFHEELSIQSQLWLGGENLLGLEPETDGVLAQYDLDGSIAQLLLVQYPDAQAAMAGLEALEAGGIGDLVLAGGRENLLGAVFGAVDAPSAGGLLSAALEPD